MSDVFEVAWNLTKRSAAPSYHQEKNRGIENLAGRNYIEPGSTFPSGASREAAEENIYGEQGNRSKGTYPARNRAMQSDYYRTDPITPETQGYDPYKPPEFQPNARPERRLVTATPDNPGTIVGTRQDTAYGDESRIVERMPRPDQGQEDSFGSRGYQEGMDSSAFQPNTDFSGNMQPAKKGGIMSRFMRR